MSVVNYGVGRIDVAFCFDIRRVLWGFHGQSLCSDRESVRASEMFLHLQVMNLSEEDKTHSSSLVV